ncbi:uncharacterized protein LOC125904306 isoform X3 [Epinephelus fuscoguttatus]|uniref:uncharacterized protein LOC125904306 isoform X3 n=2 Tax=Epinephelus fuscoguttatus TaxID=293821 RepID=UPI0020D1988B|nr:uncharacterized protein LOC125904306 isoform X3 [Epinephelus fuscoguttatus]
MTGSVRLSHRCFCVVHLSPEISSSYILKLISCSIMNLWISSQLLVVGLFLSTSALTPEECQPLVTPLSLADRSIMYGRTNLIAGYSDGEVFNNILKLTESCWVNLSPSSSADRDVMSEENKINGTCVSTTVNVTIDSNTMTMSLANLTSVLQLLPSCDGCLLFNVNSTARNLKKLLDKMNFNSNVTEDEINFQALYLMSRESTLKDSDLEHFKQQASCLGFSREPDFLYDPKNEFCAEGEGVKMTSD